MLFFRAHRAVVGRLVMLLLACLSFAGYAHASQPLSQVRALIYSQTAAELQWSRAPDERVQVSYNAQVLGVLDANSYYIDDLDPQVEHRFALQSLNSQNELSEPTFITFSTGDFQPPVRQVYADSSDTVNTPLIPTSAPVTSTLADVNARVYSTSAVELFWRRAGAVLVEVNYNGQVLGRFDADSFYKDGLNPSSTHTFEVNALNGNGEISESHSLSFSTAGFAGSVQTVPATLIEQAAAPVVPVADQAPVQTPPADPQPEPEPEPAPVTVPVNDAPAPDPAIQPVRNGDCVVRSLAELSDCVNAAQGFQRINIRSNLSCTSNNCCPTGGALLRLDGVQSLTVEGNGYRLRREGAQRQCSLLDVTNAKSLTFRNWQLDDDSRVAPCLVTDRCPRMLHVRNSSNVVFDQITVSNSKSYAIYIQQVDGFGFVNSRLENSGVLGLYVGHSGKTSTNVRIQNSVFLDNQTNGLALLGVRGSSVDTNIISNNIFKRNHWRGQWPVAPRYGTGFTGGGQMYIAEASGVTIRGNTLSDGFCENCFIQQTLGTGVSGIEIAVPGQNSVRNVLITDNTVENHDAWGIFVNQGSSLDSSVSITNNRVLNNTVGLKVGGASVSGNTVQNR